MSDLYALLIGVDFYFPGGGYGHLGGCVRDVTHVEEFLKSRLHLPDDHIFELIAARTGGAQPAGPPEFWPTYANMVEAFKNVTDTAQPGDRVYIHYAGHGGRAKTIYPELKDDGLDEGLVPTDIGDAHTRYLRDVELNYLLQAMVDKGLVLTVVLDSCHSGSATRAVKGEVVGAQPRGIDKVDDTPRPEDSLVADRQSLISTWQERSTPQTRAAKSVSGWLLEPKGYTLLAACRASEFAFEYPFNGSESNGALTYWLLDTLRQAGPHFTYKMLHDRVMAKVHSQFDRQTPMLQGNGDVVVFGAERITPFYAVPVLDVDDDARVRLNAGEAHGLTRGAQLAIFPPSTTDFGNPANRIAQVKVIEVEDVSAWAEIVEPPTAPIEVGAQAVLESIANINFQRNVALDIADPALHAEMVEALAAKGKGFARLAATGEPVHFIVELLPNGEFCIQNSGDQPVPNLRPSICATDPDAVDRVVARLVHLARYQSVRELDVLDTVAAQKLKVELIGNAVTRPDETVELRITNTQSPGSDANILNITVLCLSSDWSITQLYPSGAANFEPLDPGKTLPLKLTTFLPAGYTSSVDIMKVFATRATTNFRWLELPALDQPVTRSATTRSASADPLEQLLAALTDETSTTRGVRLSAPAEKAWSVAEVEIRVEAA